jgi:trans-aconitate 2-methyltransferase
VYARFGVERSRPFHDLLARVGAKHPAEVVDLGCGTGTLTASLGRRWPGARLVGVDSSPEMVAAADPAVDVRLDDIATWTPDAPVDVLVTNAALQWVPGHLDLLSRWGEHLADDGWLAVQVPGNTASPSHTLLRETAAEPDFAGLLAGVQLGPCEVPDPAGYAEVLAGAGCTVDAWETTYVHVLDPAGEHGNDAVLAWVSGTALRPVLGALDDDAREAFVARYGARLREAYPRRPWGTPLAFRRVFAVGRKGPS